MSERRTALQASSPRAAVHSVGVRLLFAANGATKGSALTLCCRQLAAKSGTPPFGILNSPAAATPLLPGVTASATHQAHLGRGRRLSPASHENPAISSQHASLREYLAAPCIARRCDSYAAMISSVRPEAAIARSISSPVGEGRAQQEAPHSHTHWRVYRHRLPPPPPLIWRHFSRLHRLQ